MEKPTFVTLPNFRRRTDILLLILTHLATMGIYIYQIVDIQQILGNYPIFILPVTVEFTVIVTEVCLFIYAMIRNDNTKTRNIIYASFVMNCLVSVLGIYGVYYTYDILLLSLNVLIWINAIKSIITMMPALFRATISFREHGVRPAERVVCVMFLMILTMVYAIVFHLYIIQSMLRYNFVSVSSLTVFTILFVSLFVNTVITTLHVRYKYTVVPTLVSLSCVIYILVVYNMWISVPSIIHSYIYNKLLFQEMINSALVKDGAVDSLKSSPWFYV